MLERFFGKSAQLTVLEFLLEHDKETNYLSGIAVATNLSHSSVSRVLDPLLGMGVVKEERLGKQLRTFRLDHEHPVTKVLADFHNLMTKTLSDG